jgi:membrane associated rhomboid family serine protease
MFPIGDDNRGRHITPVVNYLLIAINIAVFLYQIQLPEGASARGQICSPSLAGTIQGFICEFGVVPGEVTQGQDLFTLLTSMFVHGGWGHIFGNMLFLWVFGDNVEDAFGHVGYLVFYLGTGLAASAAHILLNPGSPIPSVGASGAISGVLGAYLIFFGRNAIRVLIWLFVTVVPAWLMIGLWAVQQFFATFGSLAQTEQTTGGVAYAAHAGGFLAGLLLAAAIRATMGRPEQRPASRMRGYT